MFRWMLNRLLRPFGVAGDDGSTVATIFKARRGTRRFTADRGERVMEARRGARVFVAERGERVFEARRGPRVFVSKRGDDPE